MDGKKSVEQTAKILRNMSSILGVSANTFAGALNKAAASMAAVDLSAMKEAMDEFGFTLLPKPIPRAWFNNGKA